MGITQRSPVHWRHDQGQAAPVWCVHIGAAASNGAQLGDCGPQLALFAELLQGAEGASVTGDHGWYEATICVKSAPSALGAARQAVLLFGEAAGAALLPHWPVVRIEVVLVERSGVSGASPPAPHGAPSASVDPPWSWPGVLPAES